MPYYMMANLLIQLFLTHSGCRAQKILVDCLSFWLIVPPPTNQLPLPLLSQLPPQAPSPQPPNLEDINWLSVWLIVHFPSQLPLSLLSLLSQLPSQAPSPQPPNLKTNSPCSACHSSHPKLPKLYLIDCPPKQSTPPVTPATAPMMKMMMMMSRWWLWWQRWW